MTLTPERIEEILSTRHERAGYNNVAASDYDALVESYRDLRGENMRLRAIIRDAGLPVPGITLSGAIGLKRCEVDSNGVLRCNMHPARYHEALQPPRSFGPSAKSECVNRIHDHSKYMYMQGCDNVVPEFGDDMPPPPRRRCREMAHGETKEGHFTAYFTCGKELPCPEHG